MNYLIILVLTIIIIIFILIIKLLRKNKEKFTDCTDKCNEYFFGMDYKNLIDMKPGEEDQIKKSDQYQKCIASCKETNIALVGL